MKNNSAIVYGDTKKAGKDDISSLADEIGLLKYFNPPKHRYSSWKKHDMAAFHLHELGHLAMGHLDHYMWGHLKLVSTINLLDNYGFSKRELHIVASVISEIPYRPDEWSVQSWCIYVSQKHGWINTYGCQWSTTSPSLELRRTALYIKDEIGLLSAGVNIKAGIYCPTYTHAEIKKTKFTIYAGNQVLNVVDITKITQDLQTLELFNRIDSLIFNLSLEVNS